MNQFGPQLAAQCARKLKPLTVVVLDAGGHMVAMKREDRSSLLRREIAEGKAWGVLGMGFGGREFARRAQPRRRVDHQEVRAHPPAGACLLRGPAAAGRGAGATSLRFSTAGRRCFRGR